MSDLYYKAWTVTLAAGKGIGSIEMGALDRFLEDARDEVTTWLLRRREQRGERHNLLTPPVTQTVNEDASENRIKMLVHATFKLLGTKTGGGA
jgi:hypothetical protein